MTVKPQYDEGYLCSFLRSWWGERALEQGVAGSTGQINMVNEHVRSIPVAILSDPAQKYIGDKVRQAERLRAWAKDLNQEVTNTFAPLTQNLKPKQTFWRAKKAELSPYRINPKQYDPVVTDLLHRTENSTIRLVRLSALLGERGVTGGATPKGAKYIDQGTLFARVQNVKALQLDLSDAVYIDKNSDQQLARSRCMVNDIILTITGYPGTASLVTEQDLPVNINQHSVRFDISPKYSAAYICAAINSDFVKHQVNRASIGGTREALDYPSVHGLQIPLLGEQTQQWVEHAVLDIISARQLTKQLTQAAKLLVEALIEGQLTEQQLIQAESSETANHALLERLKTDGFDGKGEPLFPDIDQLEQLLEEAADQ
ncbi:hypothetical protein [Endozoicomonas sp. ONNA1]|uniref:hypothetical protein n=1 Tax=Endozoicomonas sp. ONNA1 TaxID=2828740 RepID=UPI0021483056|nr:hypothetical protein [Endozoicomonas sp. ONNA1]